MTLGFVTLMLTVLILLVATCAPVYLDILEMELCVLVRDPEMLFNILLWHIHDIVRIKDAQDAC